MIAPGAGRAGRLGAVAPVPFVGAAVILVTLIIFTPVLLASGPSPLAVQAELVVYRVVGAPTTDLYVHAVGSDVPYAEIHLGIGTGFSGSGCPSVVPQWNYTNGTDLLELSALAEGTPFVVNATVVYQNGGATTIYAAELAFAIVNAGDANEGLAISSCPATPGESPPGSWAVTNLPLSLLLVNFGAGGPP